MSPVGTVAAAAAAGCPIAPPSFCNDEAPHLLESARGRDFEVVDASSLR